MYSASDLYSLLVFHSLFLQLLPVVRGIMGTEGVQGLAQMSHHTFDHQSGHYFHSGQKKKEKKPPSYRSTLLHSGKNALARPLNKLSLVIFLGLAITRCKFKVTFNV